MVDILQHASSLLQHRVCVQFFLALVTNAHLVFSSVLWPNSILCVFLDVLTVLYLLRWRNETGN